MRKLLLPLLMVLLLLFAFIARENSTGKALIGTGREYLELLAEGKLDEVHSMLTDSLGKLLAAPALQPLTNCRSHTAKGEGQNKGGTISSSHIITQPVITKKMLNILHFLPGPSADGSPNLTVFFF